MIEAKQLAILAFALAAFFAAVPAAADEDASPRVEGHRSRVRLVAGGAGYVGVEIRLDPGFKTYWRHPGESGLPPVFDWSGSANIGAAEALFPAPTRLSDAGGVSYGYLDGVVLPVRVAPAAPGRPIHVALKFDFGVCKDICIPAQADLALTIEPGRHGDPTLIEAALARVPVKAALDAPGALAIVAVEPSGGEKPGLTVSVRAPDGARPELFVEAPEGWFMASAAEMSPTTAPQAPTPGSGTFAVEILDRPAASAGPIELRLTLVAGDRAVETTARLDAASLTR